MPAWVWLPGVHQLAGCAAAGSGASVAYIVWRVRAVRCAAARAFLEACVWLLDGAGFCAELLQLSGAAGCFSTWLRSCVGELHRTVHGWCAAC